jgi:hypothetical protein
MATSATIIPFMRTILILPQASSVLRRTGVVAAQLCGVRSSGLDAEAFRQSGGPAEVFGFGAESSGLDIPISRSTLPIALTTGFIRNASTRRLRYF